MTPFGQGLGPLTPEVAENLSRAFVRQLASRYVAMRHEANAAVGLQVPKKFVTPPDWVLRAIRIVYFGKLIAPPPVTTAKDAINAFGAIVGMTKTWEAFLNKPPSGLEKVEARLPFATSMRTKIEKIGASASAAIRRFDAQLKKAKMSPELQRAFLAGQGEGAAAIVDETGEINEAKDIRTEVAYLVWLYWPQVRLLESMTELELFLREYRQDDVSRKNLEKICREIGLRFKGRGRPKNLLRRGDA